MAGAMIGLPASPVPESTTLSTQRVQAVVAEHYDLVWRSLRRFGVAEAEADDAAQQVFCVFARRLGDVPPEKERTFLSVSSCASPRLRAGSGHGARR